MNIPDIRWRVKITCAKDKKHNLELAEAFVTFQPPEVESSRVGPTLRIHEINSRVNHEYDALYVRAKILALDSRRAVFTARYWSSKFGGKKSDFKLGPEIRVECDF